MRNKIEQIIFLVFVVAILLSPATVLAATKKKAVVKKLLPPVPQAQLLISSGLEFRVYPGDPLALRFGFKNTGKVSWDTRQLTVKGAAGFSTSTPLIKGTFPKGRLEIFTVNLVAPDEPDDYQYEVELVVNGKPVSYSKLIIPVVVLPKEATATGEFVPLAAEPRIRVALMKPKQLAKVRVNEDYYLSSIGGDFATTTIAKGELILLNYDVTSTIYSVEWAGTAVTSTWPWRLSPVDPVAGYFVLESYADHPKWNRSYNYNQFRDSLELRWSTKNKELWLINELPMEFYLKGLIETGASDALEFQKAIITAARSYAYVFLPDGIKYPTRLFDIHAVWDQYYKGYTAEKINKTGVRAVDETRGLVITYNNQPVVTPYFTRSDGMTRGWREVWGGADKPWLIPVVAKYDKSKKMFGHGVGMSTTDVRERIKKDGWTFEQGLKYYYTGVEVKKLYE